MTKSYKIVAISYGKEIMERSLQDDNKMFSRSCRSWEDPCAALKDDSKIMESSCKILESSCKIMITSLQDSSKIFVRL